ncbi:MAG TPA: hypothetical protein VIV27_08860 [Halioglobus sp.]
MSVLQAELEYRWRAMFAALAGGNDVPPSQRLRAEGMMEAAALLGIATPAEMTVSMDRCYQAAYGRDINEDFGADWQEFFPFPQIPAMALRAPVYPSTRD